MKIAYLGGSFDPVHFGHLCMAQDALEQLCLDKVVFMPAAQAPMKNASVHADAGHRLAMLRLATEGDSRFQVSDDEVRRGGVNYTIDTVRLLRGCHPDDELHWILGADQLAQLHRWHQIDQLVREISFVCFDRPGCAKILAPRIDALRLHHCRGHMLEISSTEIRERARKGLPLGCFMPHKAIVYLQENHLYL